nr:hypothetical protein [Tanacetum cinerariifolium]
PIPPPTIPSIILENLPTFNSAFRFEEGLRLLETSFSEYRQTNQFADAVKKQVSRILPQIEESVNATLEAEVLTRSSHSSRTLYAIAADLSEMELKKILIEKMEGNKSIQRSDEQRNLYKALVEARPPSPDCAWNTALPAAQGDAQSWISDLARQTDAR